MLELLSKGADETTAMFDERVTDEAGPLRLVLVGVHRRKEAAALDGQRGLRGLSVVELPDAVRVAASLEDAPRNMEDIQSMLGV